MQNLKKSLTFHLLTKENFLNWSAHLHLFRVLWRSIKLKVWGGLIICSNRVLMVFLLMKWVLVKLFKQFLYWPMSHTPKIFGDHSSLLPLTVHCSTGNKSLKSSAHLWESFLIGGILNKEKHWESSFLQRNSHRDLIPHSTWSSHLISWQSLMIRCLRRWNGSLWYWTRRRQ